jgi:hypothetical protein
MLYRKYLDSREQTKSRSTSPREVCPNCSILNSCGMAALHSNRDTPYVGSRCVEMRVVLTARAQAEAGSGHTRAGPGFGHLCRVREHSETR